MEKWQDACDKVFNTSQFHMDQLTFPAGEAQLDEGARSYRRSSISDFPLRSREPPTSNLSTNLRVIELKKKVRTVTPGEEDDNKNEGIICKLGRISNSTQKNSKKSEFELEFKFEFVRI